jgi:hypothetical protein
MLPGMGSSCRDMLGLLGVPMDRTVRVLVSLSEEGRLHRAGLVAYRDEDVDLADRDLVVDPVLVEAILAEHRGARRTAPARTERELLRLIARLVVTLRKKSEQLEYLMDGYGSAAEHYTLQRRAASVLREVDETLARNPDWPLARCLRRPALARSAAARTIFLILLGRELGLLDEDDSLFEGRGLARAVAGRAEEVRDALRHLRPASALLRGGYVRPSGSGEGEQAEYELGDTGLGLAGIERRNAGAAEAISRIREPTVRMERLVLSARVRRSLDMAVAQARHARVLIRDWGLGEAIPYGRAVTLLFAGPPGVGKTACAEAVAAELGRPVLVADYARIVSCWVGATEKNIVATFAEARRAGAVLVWDEADAMLYDRDRATHTWEVRDVNVLLAELERFEGVCVLATNRRPSLDPALARRISLKVLFERPDRDMRRRIWERLLPSRLPLADDVDLDRLAAPEMTGGEIKNCVLNAARLALVAGRRQPVRMQHFEEAVRLERETQLVTRRIGF